MATRLKLLPILGVIFAMLTLSRCRSLDSESDQTESMAAAHSESDPASGWTDSDGERSPQPFPKAAGGTVRRFAGQAYLDAVDTGGLANAATNRAIPLKIDIIPAGNDWHAIVLWNDSIKSGSTYLDKFEPTAEYEVAFSSRHSSATESTIRLQKVRLIGNTLSGQLIASSSPAPIRFAAAAAMDPNKADSHSTPSAPIAPDYNGTNFEQALDGVYVGTCRGAEQGLIMLTTRWRGPTANRFGGSDSLQGSAEAFSSHSSLCNDETACFEARYDLKSYDAAKRELNLRNAFATRHCLVEKDALICDGCRLSRQDNLLATQAAPVAGPFETALRVANADIRAIETPAEVPTNIMAPGQYYGYLQHKDGRSQLLAMHLEPNDNNASVALYLGEGDSNEMVIHHLSLEQTSESGDGATDNERSVGHTNSAPPYLLSGAADGILLIEQASTKTLHGQWLSKSRGYIGPVHLHLGIVPELATTARLVSALSGQYQGDTWRFEISVSAAVSESPGQTSPVSFYGWAQENLMTARQRRIVDGSYDVYTNTIALQLDDGRVISGLVQSDGMQLRWPARARRGDALHIPRPQLFRRIPIDESVYRRAELLLP